MSFPMKKLLLAFALAALTVRAAETNPFDQTDVPLEADAPDAKLAKIVILAGGPGNKPGHHEYFAGSALLMKWLKQTPGVWPVMARDGWPKNEKIFEGAKAVVYYGDGGGKQPFLQPDRWKLLGDLIEKKGAGFVLLHQSVDFPEDHADRIKSWLGGVWTKDIGCRGHWDMEFKNIPEHAITRGVKPMVATGGDGWLYNLRFADKITPLLTAPVPDKSRSTDDAKAHTGRDEIIAWAYERPGGGRAFAHTGCHLHANWDLESQRKLVVNGILWSAKVDVPPGGAPADLQPDELNRHLDDKRQPAAASAPGAK
jgi:trehalose utilization protein